jgi:3-hydroxyisobutyrate dehydrogenase-like beta-hydroxyacid dehydrogenase
MKVGFVGLGAMGLPMARNLARAGHDLTVFNRTAARAEALAGEAAVAGSIAEAAADAELVITMLADDAAVERIALGAPAEGGQVTDHLVASPGSGAVHVAMSTIGPALAHRLALAHEAAGQGFVSLAPVVVKGLPWSAIIEAYGEAIASQRFDPPGFTLRLGLKDVRLVLDAADEASVPLPLEPAARPLHRGLREGGRGPRLVTAVTARRAGLRTG